MYYAIVFGSIFLSFLYSKSKDPYFTKICKWSFFLLLAIPLICRMDIGTDYKNYISVYNQLKYSGYNSVDVGWRMINNLFIALNLPVQIILMLAAFFTVLFFSKKIEKKDFFTWSLVFITYLYFPAYNIVRQILSISIAFYMLRRDKKDWKNLLLYLVAISIHFSSIFFIFLLFDYKRLHFKKLHILFIAILLFFVLTFVISPKDILIRIISLFKRYRYYADKIDMMGAISSSGITILFDFLVLLVLVYEMDLNKVSHNQEMGVYFLLLGASILFPLMRQFFIFARLKYSFYAVSLFLVMNQKKKKLFNLAVTLLFIAYSMLSLYLIVVRGNDGLYPYKSIFSL